MATEVSLDTSEIRDWRSIITLIVFVLTNLVVLFPFHIPLPIWRPLWNGWLKLIAAMRIVPPKEPHPKEEKLVWLNFPMDFVTGPLIADLFLLAILAIGAREVHDGTVGADNIEPIDIMVFFLTLAYIAISIDASGLIRWLAFKVLQRGGGNGRRLFFYLYLFFFLLASFVGNDPIVLSGTAFLAYMTRVSSNIKEPGAWIHTQFAMANVGSAILVSSNPTNLVLSGAFNIKFIVYTANMIVPVVVTAIVLFPFLLWIIFNDRSLIPNKIELHELPEEMKKAPAVNPNIPVRENAEEANLSQEEKLEQEDLRGLQEIMNPFVDRGGAWFGAVIMAATLVTILAINAADQEKHPVYWITLPAGVIMFSWDVVNGWLHREETREIARKGRQLSRRTTDSLEEGEGVQHEKPSTEGPGSPEVSPDGKTPLDKSFALDGQTDGMPGQQDISPSASPDVEPPANELSPTSSEKTTPFEQNRATLQSLIADGHAWCQVTFPTVTTVFSHLPLKLVPFGLCMFVLVQGLVTKGWVPVFAHGWDHWVNKTGVIGAIGGMGFLSVILCNFAGTNIGTTILLCRVIQAWVQINKNNNTVITQRTFWATVYSMAIGVNYGAFSTAISASLAGLLWRDILERKHITVKSLEFARVNLPIIAITMVVGLVILIGEVYLTRNTDPYIAVL